MNEFSQSEVELSRKLAPLQASAVQELTGLLNEIILAGMTGFYTLKGLVIANSKL